MRRPMLFWLLLTLMLSVPSRAGAQWAQRSEIRGVVTDSTGSIVVSARVELAGRQLLRGVRATETDSTGMYRFTALLPGEYSVKASAPGLHRVAKTGITLPVETTYDVNFTLEVAPVTESMDVKAGAALIDVRRSSSPTVFDAAALHDLPTARTLASVLSLAPGVVTTPPLYGITGEVAFGGTQASNGFKVDGVDLTESSLGDQWTDVNYNWLGEVEVVGLGAAAEHDGFTGAIANGVLRSGSNRISALGEWLTTRQSWSSNNLSHYPSTEERPVAPRTILEWWDLNGQVGAPIVKDHLWVFGGANSFHHDYRAFDYAGPGHTEQRTSRTLVKIDATAGRHVTLQGFWTRDATDLIGSDLGRYNPDPVASADQLTRSHAWNARATWVPSGNLVAELRASGNTGTHRSIPHPPATMDGPSPGYVADTGLGCCNAAWADEWRRTTTVTGTVDKVSAALGGTHDVKIGIEVESAPVDSQYGYPTNRSVVLERGEVVGYTEWNGDHLAPSTRRLTLFAQDRWTVGPRVTIEPGVRVERLRGSIPSRDNIVTTTPIGPRLGVAWDVTGRQNLVVRGHYGRYHDRLFGHAFESFEPNAYSPHIVYEVTPDGAQEQFRFAETGHAVIDGTLKQPHVDQVVVGVERRIWAHTTVQLQYVGRRFGSFMGYVDRQLSSWSTHQVVDPGPDGVYGNADDGGTITVYRPYGSDFDTSGRDLLLSNPDDAHRSYHGLQAIVTRRFASRYQYQVSYTWSRTEGNVGNEYHTNATYWSLSPLGSIASNPNVARTAVGASKYDYSEFKALGSYRAPWFGGFTTAGVFRWHDGVRWQRTVIQSDPFFLVIPVEPQGSRRAPSLGSLDLRIDKQFTVRPAGTIGVYVDVFNATNVGRATDYIPFSGSNFGHVWGWTDPRTARLGLRYEF